MYANFLLSEKEDSFNIGFEPFLESADQSDTKDVVMKKYLDSVSAKSFRIRSEEQHDPDYAYSNKDNHMPLQ